MFCFNFDAAASTSAIDAAPSLPMEWKRQKTSQVPQPLPEMSWEEWWERAGSTADHMPTRQSLVQYLWHYDMINDSPRNGAFRRAIADAIQATGAVPGPKVLDVGTGSGLLALLAAQAGAAHVTALETEAALARVATRNVRLNRLEGVVDVTCVHSGSAQPAAVGEPCQLVVAELLDSSLLGEEFITVLRDAKAKGWMAEGCRVVPSRARIFAQLIESDYLARAGTVNPASMSACLGEASPSADELRRAGGEGLPGVSPFECPLAQLLRSGQARALSDPFSGMEIDFENLPTAAGHSRTLTVQVTASGHVHAVVFWWECAMDRDAAITLDNSPYASGALAHQDHWVQAYTLVGATDGGGVACVVATGDNVTLDANHDDRTVWFGRPQVVAAELTPEAACAIPDGSGATVASLTSAAAAAVGSTSVARASAALCDLFDAERVALLNDVKRNTRLHEHVRAAVDAVAIAQSPDGDGDPRASAGGWTAVHVGDSSCVLLALASCAAADTRRGEHAGGGSAPATIVGLMSSDDCLRATCESLAALDLLRRVHCTTCEPHSLFAPASISLVCAEPYFHADAYSKTWAHASLLRIWLSFYALSPYLAPGATLLPAAASLMVAVVECESLWRARQPCHGLVEGLDLSALNELHSFDKIVSSLPPPSSSRPPP